MGYKGLPPYVQRMMNAVFRFYKDYARCYIDDIVIFSKIFLNYIEHIDTIF
jgi:hypothetical protein